MASKKRICGEPGTVHIVSDDAEVFMYVQCSICGVKEQVDRHPATLIRSLIAAAQQFAGTSHAETLLELVRHPTKPEQ